MNALCKALLVSPAIGACVFSTGLVWLQQMNCHLLMQQSALSLEISAIPRI